MPITSANNCIVFESMNATGVELIHLLKSTAEAKVNMVPFEGSWTIAQVADHITLSNTSIAKALSLAGTPINRAADERAGELEDIFLDFSKKYKAPGFIIPTQDVYEKEELINQLEQSFTAIKEASSTDLAVLINHPAFGDISKLEILYFVWFHTQRHLQQVKNILYYLEGKQQ
ncbi:MAG: DinB family protein [Chitinophagaceae bacterium]|nr:DinB family protein [Chitinophagaceae bacterium]